MLYADVVTALGDLLQYPITNTNTATPSTDNNFNNILPRAFEYTEGRIYRELDFVANRTVDSSTNLTANSRTVALPSITKFFVIQGVNVISSIGSATYVTETGSQTYVSEDGTTTYVTETSTLPMPAAGIRNRLEMISKDVMDIIWPLEQGGPLYNTLPTYACLLNTSTLLVAPTPDQNYVLEYTGIIRPSLLAYNNTSNYITVSYPELYIAACMVFMSGFQRDFSAQSGDKDMPMSWENLYQTLKESALLEEQRRKFQSTNWSPYSATPLSNPRP